VSVTVLAVLLPYLIEISLTVPKTSVCSAICSRP